MSVAAFCQLSRAIATALSDSRSKPVGRDRVDGLGAKHESGGAKQSPEVLSADPIREALEPDVVERVARAIAERGFGRPWDDFNEVDAFDTDQCDLLEYARAAISSMPTIADEGEQ
jgi:hypothetical protein